MLSYSFFPLAGLQLSIRTDHMYEMGDVGHHGVIYDDPFDKFLLEAASGFAWMA